MNASALPKASGLPLLGVALKFGPEWVRTTRKHLGDVFSFDLPGGNGGVMATHPDDVRLALIESKGVSRSEFPPRMHDVLAPITGDGLIGRTGPAWTERRGMMQPGFRRQRLADLVPIMLEAIDRQLESIASRFVRDGRPFDALPEMHALTLSVLIRSLLGSHLDARDTARAGEAVDLTMKAVTFAPIEFGKQRLARRAARAFEDVSMRIIQERRASPPEARPRDLLTAMIEMQDAHGGGLDDTSIRFELSGLFIAGKETSAISLSWFLALLPQRPDIAQRLVEEIDRVIGSREPQAADLPEFRYLEAALQENLRLHPPVWLLFPRKAADDVTLGGHVVRRGTTVWVSPFATHHHEAFWERPGEFDPERFTQQGTEGSARHPYAWIPFGGGPRVCIGARFALMSMQLFVARLLQRYRIEWADTQPVQPKVIFNTRFPRRVPIRLVPRT
ncbi:cytochrome P450 [Hyalangium versicolor]|uniref:cytochrome P450 n=1 Tax=Hyalangium versicolor TaxID=2861190 RepID=UPI001CCB68C1|nr:cytochrome P450 [Hyalangium versicolor]